MIAVGVVLHDDALAILDDWLRDADRWGTVDAVLTDPPYYLSRPDMKRPDGYVQLRDFGEGDGALPIGRLAFAFATLCKADSNVLVWCSDRQVGEWVSALSAGFARVMVGAWVKTNPSPNVRKRTWTQATELWVWAARGMYTFNWLGQQAMHSVDRAPHVAGGERMHPTQKPEVVCERHVRVLTRRGDTVLDPFAGSGTYGAVCKRLGRECVSIEADAEHVAVARTRIDAERVQLELPETEVPVAEQPDLFGDNGGKAR